MKKLKDKDMKNLRKNLKKIKRRCFICLDKIKSAIDNKYLMHEDDPLADASCWTSIGNYGSTVIDELFTGLTWEICICDDCLKDREHYIIKHKKYESMI